MADILIGNVKGPQGVQGNPGEQGVQGEAATIEVGTVSTTAYGNPAQVINSGTENEAVFDFVIPQGRPGEETTSMSALTLDTVTTQSDSFPVPVVGDRGAVVFGKIIKFFTDTVASLANKLNISDVVNNLTSTATNKPLSAAQGKALKDDLTSLLSYVSTPINSYTGALSYTFPDTWGRAVITVLSGNFRCETTILRSDVSDEVYYHYIGGYLTGSNNFGASVVLTKTQFTCVGVYQNGSDIKSSARSVVRLYKY